MELLDNKELLEKIIINYLYKEKQEYIKEIDKSFFKNETIKLVFIIIKNFYTKYYSLPSLQQILTFAETIDKNKESKIDLLILETIFEINLNDYDQNWLFDTFNTWVKANSLENGVIKLIEYIKNSNISSSNIENILFNAKNIINKEIEDKIYFLNNDLGSNFFDAQKHFQTKNNNYSTGYNYLDTCGGFSPKTLVCFMAPPKVGKSWFLCNLAANSVRLGYNSVYITLEMSESKILKRIGANLLHIDIKKYDEISSDIQKMSKILQNFRQKNLNIPGEFYVKEFPTSAASVDDIEYFLKNLEKTKNIKLKNVFVDYINIIKNSKTYGENLYLKIKQISEELRAMAVCNEWCVITATQTSRKAFDTSDISGSDISESAGLIHTIDQLYAIIQDAYLYSNKQYILKLIANRDEGYKNSKKKFTINYNYGKIEETDEPIIMDNF